MPGPRHLRARRRLGYSLVIEGDPTGYSAYVPELPTILVTGRSLEERTTRATEAIRPYLETVRNPEALD